MHRYFSADRSVSAISSEITHVCVAPSMFSFLLYQLIVDEDVAKNHTYYFVDAVPEHAKDMLMTTAFKHFVKGSVWQSICNRLYKLWISWFKTWNYPFLKNAEIYAFDSPGVNLYIGNRPYNYIEDAPGSLRYLLQENSEMYLRMIRRSNSVLGKLQRWIYGDVYINYFTTNKWCKAVYLTDVCHSPLLKGKDVYVKSLNELWAEASEVKKNYIMQLFDLSADDLRVLNSKPMVFFSQPLREDFGVTDQEYADIMQRVLSRYNVQDVLIKTHPRDKFPYNKYFPDVQVFDKPINSQLYQMVGWHPQRIGTFFSTAIDAFPESIECDYFGVDVHPHVKAFWGEHYQPSRKANKVDI